MNAIVNQKNEIFDLYYDVVILLMHPGERDVFIPHGNNEIRILFDSKLFVTNPGIYSHQIYYVED